MIKVEGEAQLKSNSSNEIVIFDADELVLEATSGDERQMGTETLYTGAVERTGRDGKSFGCEWTVSEYPVGVLNHVSHDLTNATLVKDFDISYEHQPDDE